jgi:hypothetical protein
MRVDMYRIIRIAAALAIGLALHTPLHAAELVAAGAPTSSSAATTTISTPGSISSAAPFCGVVATGKPAGMASRQALANGS